MKKRNIFNVNTISGLLLLTATLTYTLIPDGSCATPMGSGPISISPFIGEYMFDGAQNYRTRPIYGLRLGNYINENGSIELVGGYIRTRDQHGPTTDNHRNIFRYSVDGLYRFGTENSFIQGSPLVPFVAAGFGGMTFNDRQGVEDYSRWQVNYGPGLLYFVSKNMAIRADIRHLILIGHHNYSNLEGTLGFSYLFGSNKESSPQKDNAKPIPAPVTKQTPPAPPLTEAAPTNMILQDVHFTLNSFELTIEGMKILNHAISVIEENPLLRLRIEGHTSASGTKEHNQTLSEERAAAVKNYLVNNGHIETDRLVAVGYGEDKPFMTENHPDKIYSKEAKANRRVPFVVLVKKSDEVMKK